MRYLGLGEVVELHRRLLHATGGAPGIRDLGALESAIAQPKATFGGVDLHPTVVEKAAALCFALVHDHPFIDGNKRVGHAAMETFLVLWLSPWTSTTGLPRRRTTALSGVAGPLERFVRLRAWRVVNHVTPFNRKPSAIAKKCRPFRLAIGCHERMDPTPTRHRKYVLGEAPVDRDIGNARAGRPLDANIDTPFATPASDLDGARPFYPPAPLDHYRGFSFGVARTPLSSGPPRRPHRPECTQLEEEG
jgi:death-on-curing protein